MNNPSAQLIEIASWRLACELMRRHASSLLLIETHPGGGQYDCLAFYDRATKERVLDLNRAGSAHGERGSVPSEELWPKLLAEDDPKSVVDAVEAVAGLSTPRALPEETADVVVYRFVAELLAGRTFSRNRWECRNGFLDSSGMAGGPREEFFRAFPAMASRRQTRLETDLLGIAEYRFWFVLRDGSPVVALESATGAAWNRSGQEFRLFERFRTERRIGPLVPLVAGSWLP